MRRHGRVDYVKVNDEYIFVGNVQGSYSKARPARVGGVKTETVRVYKI